MTAEGSKDVARKARRRQGLLRGQPLPERSRRKMRINRYHRILWDFNGTLLDDVELGIRVTNTLLIRYGLPTIASPEDYREIFGFPVRDYYEKLGLAHEGEEFARVAREWMAEYRAGEHTAPLRSGALAALDAIREAGVPQGVLSATEVGMLEEQVTALGIRPYFDRLLGLGDIYAADKSDIARHYAGTHPGERVLMIGDTLHDAETAAAGGFDCVLLEGGHQNRARLEKAGCPVISDFEAFLAWLKADGTVFD